MILGLSIHVCSHQKSQDYLFLLADKLLTQFRLIYEKFTADLGLSNWWDQESENRNSFRYRILKFLMFVYFIYRFK